MNVVFVCILELFHPALLCLLQQLLWDPSLQEYGRGLGKDWSHALSSGCSMVCHGRDVFSTIC